MSAASRAGGEEISTSFSLLKPERPSKAGCRILVLFKGAGVEWLPVVVIFILLMVNRRDMMGEYVNTLTFNIVAWVTAIAMIILSLVLAYTAAFQGTPTG
jgi:hypothetical protein